MSEAKLQTSEDAFAAEASHALAGDAEALHDSVGLFWELNPGPFAPEARIIPLDQTAN